MARQDSAMTIVAAELISLGLASGALAFFGDKYPEQNVRVVTIPDPAAPHGFYSKALDKAEELQGLPGDVGSQ